MTPESTNINDGAQIKVKHHSNGKVSSKIHYVNGEQHGLETEWWDNGQKWWEEMWRLDKQHGLSTWWHGNGYRNVETTRANGAEHGVQTYWNESEEKEKEIYYFKGKEYTRIEWDDERNVTRTYFPTLPQERKKVKPINKSKNHIKK